MDKVQQRTYELTYLVPGSMTDNEVAQVRNEVDAILKKHKASVVKNEDWGRKPLSYIITHDGKKQTDGVYTHLVLQLDSSKAPLLDRDVYLSAKVMRHLLLVADEQSTNSEDQKAE